MSKTIKDSRFWPLVEKYGLRAGYVAAGLGFVAAATLDLAPHLNHHMRSPEFKPTPVSNVTPIEVSSELWLKTFNYNAGLAQEAMGRTPAKQAEIFDNWVDQCRTQQEEINGFFKLNQTANYKLSNFDPNSSKNIGDQFAANYRTMTKMMNKAETLARDTNNAGMFADLVGILLPKMPTESPSAETAPNRRPQVARPK